MKFRVYLYIILTLYIFSSSLRVITTKLTDLHMITEEDGTTSEFRHPVFQTLVGFIGEMMVAITWAIFYMLANNKPVCFS